MKKGVVINYNFVPYQNILLKLKRGFESAFNALLKASVIAVSLILLHRMIVNFMLLAKYYGAISIVEKYRQVSTPVFETMNTLPVL